MTRHLFLFLFSVASALGASVELTRIQASDLYSALASVEPGLSPATVIAAADNMIALRPHVESLDKGKLAYNRALRGLAKLPAQEAETHAASVMEQLENKANEKITVELSPMTLTDEEIVAAKIKPATLSLIRQFLKPIKK